MIDVTVVNPVVEEINREHELFQKSMQTGLEHAIRCGELLIEAKGWTEWGDWNNWIEANCKFNRKTAFNYMKVASNVQRVGQMPMNTSLREALKLLSEPKEKRIIKPEPEKELAFSWTKDPEIIAMQDGVQAVKNGVAKLVNSSVDPITAGHLLEMTRSQLQNIIRDINRHIA